MNYSFGEYVSVFGIDSRSVENLEIVLASLTFSFGYKPSGSNLKGSRAKQRLEIVS